MCLTSGSNPLKVSVGSRFQVTRVFVHDQPMSVRRLEVRLIVRPLGNAARVKLLEQ
jgi:hypothetical protein